jgi:hypothetical protein
MYFSVTSTVASPSPLPLLNQYFTFSSVALPSNIHRMVVMTHPAETNSGFLI